MSSSSFKTSLQINPRSIPVALLWIACISSCKRKEDAIPAIPEPATVEAAPVAPAWAKEDPSKWPQLVLTNEAEFRGHTGLSGASAFLIETPKGEILGATAKHLLGVNGGVEPTVAPEKLDQDLISWSLFPRTRGDLSFAATGLGAASLRRPHYDWLFLKLDPAHGHLPATPLKLRSKPAVVGEEVFMVGVPYSEPKAVQNVYRGKVTLREAGDRFRFSVSPPVNVTGFSGCPILDRDGQVIGVFSVIFEPRTEGELHVEGGAEDAASGLGALR